MASRIYVVGAGVSVDAPSSIPPAFLILDEVLKWIADVDQKLASEIRACVFLKPTANPFSLLQFEAIIEAIGNVVGDILPTLTEIAKFGAPNLTHHVLAREIARGARVITTNFDTRIETACALAGIDPALQVLNLTSPTVSNACRLLKLHGSFRPALEAPWATLLRIGNAGIGFSRFPQLEPWFRTHSAGGELIVLGYSASDHFDVVPLIETATQSVSINWMHYDPAALVPLVNVIDRGVPPSVPLREASFSDQTLATLKYRVPQATIRQIVARSVPAALRLLSVDIGDEKEASSASAPESLWTQNLQSFREALQSIPLAPDHFEQLALVLLQDDAFGGHLGPEFGEEPEPEPAVHGLGDRMFAETELASVPKDRDADAGGSSGIDGSSLPPEEAAHHWTLVAADEARRHRFGPFAQAALSMVDALCASGEIVAFRADQMRAMVLSDGFHNASVVGDQSGMRQILRLAQEWFARSGHLTLGIGALVMAARLYHFEATCQGESTSRHHAIIGGLRAAETATYFALRTGRTDTTREAVWLYAFFLEHAGQRATALGVLERFLPWASDDDMETRGFTLGNIHGLLLRQSDWKQASACLSRMIAIPARKWKSKAIFVMVARAERELRRRRFNACRNLLALGGKLLADMNAQESRPHRQYLEKLTDELTQVLTSKRRPRK